MIKKNCSNYGDIEMKKQKLVSLSLILSLIVPYTIPLTSSLALDIEGSSNESVEIAKNSVENINNVKNQDNDGQLDLQIADRRNRRRGNFHK